MKQLLCVNQLATHLRLASPADTFQTSWRSKIAISSSDTDIIVVGRGSSKYSLSRSAPFIEVNLINFSRLSIPLKITE
jgi:hypothetical protein